QAPMPLPLLELPLAPTLSGQPPKNLDTEVEFWTVSGSTNSAAGGFANTTLTTADHNYFIPYQALALQDQGPPVKDPLWVFPTNVSPTTVQGWLGTNRPVALAAWGGVPSTNANRWRFSVNAPSRVATNRQALLFNPTISSNWVVTVTSVDVVSNYVEVQ